MTWFRRYWPYIVLVVLLAVNATVWIKREPITDWWRLRDYQPSQEIAVLVTDDAMTDKARHLFYVNHPTLENKEDFNMHCSDKSEDTAVLGCYHGNRQGIYLYAVTDSRLEGVRQVTAAHEMLHQAYDRLSNAERERIDKLLQDFYTGGMISEDIKTKIDTYKKQSDVVLANEMHSIFGSEVRNLPHELEEYYKQYFVDRSKVVGFSESYRAEFTRRQELVKKYDTQLANIKRQIDSNKASLETKMTALKAKEAEIDQDVSGSNQAEYNSDVQTYNSTVQAYNAQLAATRTLIDQHNQIVGQRNDIAVQEQELQQALDSRLETPSPKQ
ncbi:MAG: hypothetical protein ABWX94_02645 [Candidatus Saccharimonadales bacterium]